MERQDLPDGAICEAEETTLSNWCETCELYGDDALFDFDWIEAVDTAIELEEM